MRNIILLLIISLSQITFSQNISAPEELILIESDQFENIFIVTENNNLIKYPKNNYENYLEFSNIEDGYIQKIMVSNQFRSIIFYGHSQKILFLDKNLNRLNITIDLYNLFDEKIIDVTNFSNLLFFISELNEILIYDIGRGKIIKSKKYYFL